MTESVKATMRAARELALNLLFQVDVAKLTLEEAVKAALENAKAAPEVMETAIELAWGSIEYQPKADSIASSLAPEWPTDRQPSVDRNILRLALYELEARKETPKAVTISEAIELAKLYGTLESSRFVNGVLAEFIRQRELVEVSQGDNI